MLRTADYNYIRKAALILDVYAIALKTPMQVRPGMDPPNAQQLDRLQPFDELQARAPAGIILRSLSILLGVYIHLGR